MNAWRLTRTGEPAGAYPCPGDPTTLTPTERADLIVALRTHQESWLITGPCLDGGWYAIPRHNKPQPWPRAPTLPDLIRTLDQHPHHPPARDITSFPQAQSHPPTTPPRSQPCTDLQPPPSS